MTAGTTPLNTLIHPDRMFAFPVRGASGAVSAGLVMLACLRGKRWHVERDPGRGGRSLVPQSRMCHTKAARGIFQEEFFEDSWMTLDGVGISRQFYASLEHRAGLIFPDLGLVGLRPSDGFQLDAAYGYPAYEPGRVMVACPRCGAWHAIDMEETPAPGYQFSALASISCPAALRVTVQAERWRTSWAQSGKDGRRTMVYCSPAYASVIGSKVRALYRA